MTELLYLPEARPGDRSNDCNWCIWM